MWSLEEMVFCEKVYTNGVEAGPGGHPHSGGLTFP